MIPSRAPLPTKLALAASLGVVTVALLRLVGKGVPAALTAGGARPTLVAVSLGVAVVATVAAVVLARGWVPAGLDATRLRRDAGTVGLPLAILLAQLSGGVASPAIVAVALGLLAVSATRGLGRGALCAAGALLALLLGARAGLAPAAIGSTVLVGLGLLPAWLAHRGDGRVDEARRRATQLETFFSGRATPMGVTPIPGRLRTDAIRAHAEEAERRHEEVVAEFLEDVRVLLGADRAIYWRFTRSRDALEALAWAGGGPRPALATAGGSHVDWAAREGLPAMDTADGKPSVAVVPVLLAEGEVLGALSVHRPDGLRAPPERLRAWLPRHAVHLARLAALAETTGELSRESVKTRAIVAAALAFQRMPDEERLAREICTTALQVTGASRAALVQWDAADRTGRVAFTTEDGDEPAGARPLAAGSVIAAQCVEAQAQAWEDARATCRGRVLLWAGEPDVDVGSLGFYPLRDRDDVVHGAIVVADAKPGRVRIDDLRNVDLLGRFASFALESVWEIAIAEERARTDQLTGLYNRRHFDEAVKSFRSLRNPPPCSIVVADVDFFKKVNDTYGHDAGDAVLKVVAQTFRDSVREGDVCARFGGEEIAVLLPDTMAAGAVELAERLRQTLERRVIRHATREIRVTASFGVATYPGTARSWDALFTAADKALYDAKHAGRNRVRSAPVVDVPVTT